MSENKLNIDEANLSVDLSDATQAVKENRFQDAINLLKIILKMLMLFYIPMNMLIKLAVFLN